MIFQSARLSKFSIGRDTMNPIILIASISTFLGGLLALKISDKEHLVTAFGAGTVIATALFNLLPESMSLVNKDTLSVMGLCAVGFSIYFMLNNFIALTCKGEKDCKNASHISGLLNVGGLSFHSLLDGFAIGLSFQVNSAVGFVVALAIIIHDLSDGINTVGMVLRSGQSKEVARKWLIIDTLAPLVGYAGSMCVNVSTNTLGLFLAVFSGAFFYIGASDLVPECHHDHPKIATSLFFLMGMGMVWQIVYWSR